MKGVQKNHYMHSLSWTFSIPTASLRQCPLPINFSPGWYSTTLSTCQAFSPAPLSERGRTRFSACCNACTAGQAQMSGAPARPDQSARAWEQDLPNRRLAMRAKKKLSLGSGRLHFPFFTGSNYIALWAKELLFIKWPRFHLAKAHWGAGQQAATVHLPVVEARLLCLRWHLVTDGRLHWARDTWVTHCGENIHVNHQEYWR